MAPALDTLTEAHAAVYDRQLRVWGVEVQRRLMEAKVLILGLGGLAAEIAKNIVLAGVGTVALRDDAPAASAPAGNFLVTDADRGTAKTVAEASAATLAAMNPLMVVKVEPGPAGAAELAQPLAEGEQAPAGSLRSLVASYDVVVATGLPLHQVAALSDAVRAAGRQLFAGEVRGVSSYVFVDLGGQHTYTDKGVPTERVVEFGTFRAAMSCGLGGVTKRTHPLYLALRACYEFEQEHGRPAATLSDLPAVWASAHRLAAATAAAAAPIDTLLPPGLLEGFVTDPLPAPSASSSSAAAGGATGGAVNGQENGQENGQGTGSGQEHAGGLAPGMQPPAAALPLGELAPVCAVVGGVVANNVLRGISRVGAPLRNLFFYSLAARDGLGVEECFS
ncbi:hypothetical protein HYH03_011145 [Edaphochlamys debaryana]|uniref:THIF-type NAD/FAD binding fold domain-containing protein n=1 Tax=Edaphochlamys debaryana TaxID=47281 RepID=A0A836BWV7_9CHLO|nr:hypothetical protein HYH03_011145 [Edaphochlamys debaryana]|eukprot:KAG2490524.1 hypothetical protein HYH03_011145 [Edaphochlamys debaryana]